MSQVYLTFCAQGKLIKKRYAVFNDDGTLAELKGFEIKRRGELKLIKVFQSEVFGMFLEGNSLETCYAAVAGIANRWLDMLENRGCDLVDDELMELIGESTTLSKSLEEYGDRKSTAITTATRLGQVGERAPAANNRGRVGTTWAGLESACVGSAGCWATTKGAQSAWSCICCLLCRLLALVLGV